MSNNTRLRKPKGLKINQQNNWSQVVCLNIAESAIVVTVKSPWPVTQRSAPVTPWYKQSAGEFLA